MTLADLTSSSPLPHLGPHLPVLVISTVTCYTIQHLAHIVTPQLLGKKWDGFDAKTRQGWASHCVSMTHALVVVPLALRSLWLGALKDDPVFGYDPIVGNLLALSSGYFIWDTLDSALHSTLGFVVHGAACLAVYLFSFRPFLAGFGSCFLLWEMSTIFLNIYWFMDKTKLSTPHPKVFLTNQMIFMSVFLGARLLFGGYQSIEVIKTMYANRDRIPIYLSIIYGSGNIALNGLNVLWFSKMVKQMIAKLQGKGKSVGNGVREKKVPIAASPVVAPREL